jgi:aspartyl protease family protein
VSDGADQALNLLYLVGFLVLVVSALAARRLPIGQGLRMAAAWILIFAAAFLGFAMKDDFAALVRHVLASARGGAQTVAEGGRLRIRKNEDGHFWVDAKVNGKPLRFLIDSGATVTSLSEDDATRVGVGESDRFPVYVSTANGTVRARRGEIGRIEVGPIVRSDLVVHVSRAFGDTNVLGMNFLSSLRAWGVEGEWLVLRG